MLARMTQWLSFHDPIKLYGKVVDQNNDPVGGAEVVVAWRKPALNFELNTRSGIATTDISGRFYYQITDGDRPIIRTLGCDGYELMFDQNPVMDLDLESQQDILTNSTPTNPFILILRKKGPTTHLLKRPYNLLWIDRAANQTNDVDLVNARFELQMESQRYADLQAESLYNPSNDVWTVIYRSTNLSDGLIVSTNVLYEAPESGYQKEVAVHNPPFKLFLYTKTRNPPIYSRVDVEHRKSGWSPDPDFTVTLNALINPYGSRNLEYDVRLDKYWRINKHLTAEAKSLLANKQRPPEPDIDELIRNSPIKPLE